MCFKILCILLLWLNFVFPQEQHSKKARCLNPSSTAKRVEKFIKECQNEVQNKIVKEALELLHHQWEENHPFAHHTSSYHYSEDDSNHHPSQRPSDHHHNDEYLGHGNHPSQYRNEEDGHADNDPDSEIYFDDADDNNRKPPTADFHPMPNFEKNHFLYKTHIESRPPDHSGPPSANVPPNYHDNHHQIEKTVTGLPEKCGKTLFVEGDRPEQGSDRNPDFYHQNVPHNYHAHEELEHRSPAIKIQKETEYDLQPPTRKIHRIHKRSLGHHLTLEDRRIAGCLLQCVYSKNNAIDHHGWPTLDGLVDFYSAGVDEHGYFMATLRATDQCLKSASYRYRVNRSDPPEKGKGCDLAFDVFDCVSDQLTNYCWDLYQNDE